MENLLQLMTVWKFLLLLHISYMPLLQVFSTATLKTYFLPRGVIKCMTVMKVDWRTGRWGYFPFSSTLVTFTISFFWQRRRYVDPLFSPKFFFKLIEIVWFFVLCFRTPAFLRGCTFHYSFKTEFSESENQNTNVCKSPNVNRLDQVSVQVFRFF